MRGAVVGAVLALAISACGGTTQSPATPASPTAAPPSTTAPATPTSEPPTSPSIAPSPAVSDAARGDGLAEARAGRRPPAPERTTRGRSIRRRGLRTCSAAGTARRSTTTSGRSTSRPTHGRTLTRAAGGLRRASATRRSGWMAWASSCGLARRVRRPSSTTSGRTTPWQTTGRASRTTGRSPSPAMARVRRSATDGRLWISHGFTEDGVRFSDTRAYDFEAGTWSDETPDGRPARRALPARMLADRGWPARALRGPDDRRPRAGRSVGVGCRAVGDGRRPAPAGAQSPCRDAARRRRRGVRRARARRRAISATSTASTERSLAFEELRPRGCAARRPATAQRSSTTRATAASCSSAAPPAATRSPIPGS